MLFLSTLRLAALGTWISYNDADSIKAIVDYGKKLNVAGIFLFDASMDSIANGGFQFKLHNLVADELGGH